MPRVVLGVCGGIAAYKSVELLRLLKESGHQVTVIPTENALQFVGAATFEALSGEPVSSSVWDGVDAVRHIQLGARADVVVIAPATADFIARASHGIASDLLTNTLLSTLAPVIVAPAMHTQMWDHPATQHNIKLLRERGCLVLNPDSGRLTGEDSGIGRLPSPQSIHDFLDVVVTGSGQSLRGRHIVITAGGTQEEWDPVRFLGNRSSGKQGIALARAALAHGATVTLIAGSVDVDLPAGVELVRVQTAEDMLEAVRLAMKQEPDALIMAAAVADFRPLAPAQGKIKKGVAVPLIELAVTADVLATVTRENPDTVIFGFAAETVNSQEQLIALGREKLLAKGCTALVLNNVRGGDIFGLDHTEITIIDKKGNQAAHTGSKISVAHAVIAQLSGSLAPLHFEANHLPRTEKHS